MFQIFEQFTWWSVLDISLLAVGFYYLLLLIKRTRAAQTLGGVLVIIAMFSASSALPLTTINWVFSKFYASIIVILVIIFQDDLRHGLSRIGKRSLLGGKDPVSSQHMLDELLRATMALASQRIGALLVLERNIILSRYVDIGTAIDSGISKELIQAIFYPSSPIHDGAVIVQRGRIAAAGCFLPLTKADNLVKDYGTRHRAAVGISQETDAVVLMVSEERGDVSLVADGQISRYKDRDELRKALRRLMVDEPNYAKTSTAAERAKNGDSQTASSGGASAQPRKGSSL